MREHRCDLPPAKTVTAEAGTSYQADNAREIREKDCGLCTTH